MLKNAYDVLMAPHHGSRTADKPKRIMQWARPKVVVACQKRPHGFVPAPDPYEANGARFLSTAREGAVTIRSHVSGLVVETFRTGTRFVVRTGQEQ